MQPCLLLLLPFLLVSGFPSSIDSAISTFLQEAVSDIEESSASSTTTISPLDEGEGKIEIKPIASPKKLKKLKKKKKRSKHKKNVTTTDTPKVETVTVVEETAAVEKPKKTKKGKKNKKSYMQHLMEKNENFLRTTTEIPTTTPEPVIYDKTSGISYNQEELRQLCRQTKQMANTFGIRDVTAFASGNCPLIRLYYPDVTCDQIGVFLQYCESVGSL